MSKERWLEAGFKTYFEAKEAFGTLVQSAIAQGLEPGALFPPHATEYLGWLLAGHPTWPEWQAESVALADTIVGYAYNHTTLTSATSQISQLHLGFVTSGGAFGATGAQLIPFSGYEALHGELRTPTDRTMIAFASEVKLLLAEALPDRAYVAKPLDYRHLDRLITEFIDITQIDSSEIYASRDNVSQTFPYCIVNRDLAAHWRAFVRETSVQWGRKQ